MGLYLIRFPQDYLIRTHISHAVEIRAPGNYRRWKNTHHYRLIEISVIAKLYPGPIARLFLFPIQYLNDLNDEINSRKALLIW